MEITTILGYAGCAFAIGIPSIGSSIGVFIPGSVSHGVMAKVDEGHGKFIGMSAAPSSQTIYGLILMFVLLDYVKTAGWAVLFIGFFCGLAIALSAVFQGKVAATGILASSKKQEVFGKCFAAVGIVESFAIFALVAGIVMAGTLADFRPAPEGPRPAITESAAPQQMKQQMQQGPQEQMMQQSPQTSQSPQDFQRSPQQMMQQSPQQQTPQGSRP